METVHFEGVLRLGATGVPIALGGAKMEGAPSNSPNGLEEQLVDEEDEDSAEPPLGCGGRREQ